MINSIANLNHSAISFFLSLAHMLAYSVFFFCCWSGRWFWRTVGRSVSEVPYHFWPTMTLYNFHIDQTLYKRLRKTHRWVNAYVRILVVCVCVRVILFFSFIYYLIQNMSRWGKRHPFALSFSTSSTAKHWLPLYKTFWVLSK